MQSTCHTWLCWLPPIIKRSRHVRFIKAFRDEILWSHHPFHFLLFLCTTIVSFTQLSNREAKIQTQNSLHQQWHVKFESAKSSIIQIPLTQTTVQLYILYNCVKKVVSISFLKQRVFNTNYTNASILPPPTWWWLLRGLRILLCWRSPLRVRVHCTPWYSSTTRLCTPVQGYGTWSNPVFAFHSTCTRVLPVVLQFYKTFRILIQ